MVAKNRIGKESWLWMLTPLKPWLWTLWWGMLFFNSTMIIGHGSWDLEGNSWLSNNEKYVAISRCHKRIVCKVFVVWGCFVHVVCVKGVYWLFVKVRGLRLFFQYFLTYGSFFGSCCGFESGYTRFWSVASTQSIQSYCSHFD